MKLNLCPTALPVLKHTSEQWKLRSRDDDPSERHRIGAICLVTIELAFTQVLTLGIYNRFPLLRFLPSGRFKRGMIAKNIMK